ncbi:kinase-like domain-containing protein, partial [Baffinella frigidus]
EIAIMKKVDHPNCIKLHEVYDEKSKMYMVLDLVTGGELFDRIIARGHYSEKDAATMMTDALSALKYLHGMGIVHRDLKPENLLYASGDEKDPMYDVIKLADFGLAKVVQGGNDHTMTTTCGTPGYVAPEVLEQKGGYGPEVDVWSMGVIMYILLCGFPPFYDENNAVLFQQVHTPIPNRSTLHPKP